MRSLTEKKPVVEIIQMIGDKMENKGIYYLKAEATTDGGYLSRLWKIDNPSDFAWAKAVAQDVIKGEIATVYYTCPQMTREQAIACARYMLQTYGIVPTNRRVGGKK